MKYILLTVPKYIIAVTENIYLLQSQRTRRYFSTKYESKHDLGKWSSKKVKINTLLYTDTLIYLENTSI